jgi:flagellar hook-length control protein FliK
MEISLNSANVRNLLSSRSQFSITNDVEDASAFDLLLSLPIAPSPSVESDGLDEPLTSETSIDSSCQSCDSATEQQPESPSSAETESISAESTQSDIASSLAAIDTIAASQIPSVQEPTNTEAETASSIETANTDATQPASDHASLATEASTVETGDASEVQLEPTTQSASSIEAIDNDSPTQVTEAKTIQASSAAQSNELESSQQQNSNNDQPGQHLPTAQEEPVIEVQEFDSQTNGLAAKSQQTQAVQADEAEEKAVVSKPQSDAVRRGQQPDRRARWYERDASEEHAIESDAVSSQAEQAQAADVQDSSAIQAKEPGGADPTAELAAQLHTDSDAIGVDATTPPSASTTAGSNTSLASGLVTPSASAAEVSTDSTSESSRSMTSALERTTGKVLVGDSSKLESSQTGPQVDITRAEKARLVQRVARSFSRIGPTGGNLQIKLHPPELGALAVQVRIEGKNMTARLTTESHAAREVIMESLPQLRSRLAEQGYEVVQFTVDVASDGSSLGNQTGAGQGGQPGDSSDRFTPRSVPVDLRRSNQLRRQLDSVNLSQRAQMVSGIGKGVDIQA